MPIQQISGTTGIVTNSGYDWYVLDASATLKTIGVAFTFNAIAYQWLDVHGTLKSTGDNAVALVTASFAQIFVAHDAKIVGHGDGINTDNGTTLPTIENAGVIRSVVASGLAVASNYADIENSGRINGLTYGVHISGSNATVRNSGLIVARDSTGTGLIVTVATTVGEIENSGTIRGHVGVELDGNFTHLYNSGRVEGDHVAILGAGQPARVHNAGVLVGNVTFGAGPDSLVELAGGRIKGHVDGGAGTDTLRGNNRADHFHGGADADRLYGGGGADHLLGNAGDDEIMAGAGNDTVFGGGGDDTIFGGAGKDLIKGGAGTDHIAGKGGDDRIDVGANGGVADGGAGNDVISGKSGASTHVVAVGGRGNDRITGGAGQDVLGGGKGDDIQFGKGGKDAVYGNAGADRLHGGGSDDSVIGDAGNDMLWGGAGADHFVYQSTESHSGHDKIMDFEDGTDAISLVGFGTAITSQFGSLHAFLQAARGHSGSDVTIDLGVLSGMHGHILIMGAAGHIGTSDFIVT